MRKLALFGALALIFGTALVLERRFSQPPATDAAAKEKSGTADDKALLIVGGGMPREAPVAPAPAEAPPAPGREAAATRRDPPRDDHPKESGRVSAPAPGVDAGDRVHVVAASETLWSIAKSELGSGARYKELARWNGLAENAPLKVGSTLRLAAADASTPTSQATRPADAGAADGDRAAKRGERAPTKETLADAARTHKVEKGETLSKIAARMLGDAGRWREIQHLNAIADPANVPEGSLLKIPNR